MSKWTHVYFNAEVGIPTANSRAEAADQVRAVLNECPRITGLEKDAEIFVNIPYDSDSTEWNGRFDTYGWDRAYIIINGHLRDREKAETEEEVETFIGILKTHFSHIRNITYKVYGDEDELNYFRGKGLTMKGEE